MGVSPFAEALSALLRPLEFAARDGFAHLGRVQGLPKAMLDGSERALALAIPRDAREAVASVAKLFAQPPEGESLKRAVERARERLAPFAQPGWREKALARSTGELSGVGPKRAQALAARGLASVMDLLFHLPARWDDRRSLTPVGDLQVGRRASFVARVLGCDFVSQRPRYGRYSRGFEAIVGDETGTVTLRWFHGVDSIARQVRKDATLLIAGEVTRHRFSKRLTHPEI